MKKSVKDFLPNDFFDENASEIDEGLFRKVSALSYANKVKTYGDRANGHLRRAIDKSESESEMELLRALMEIRGMVGALTAVVMLKKG